MPDIAIYAHHTRQVLFAGNHESLRRCAEAAVDAGISLAGSDLRSADLRGASLDGVDLRGALLDGADLRGVNLSEADLAGASAVSCDLCQACLCESNLAGVNFADADFTGALAAAARIEACVFSSPTALALPFAECSLGRNVYMHEGVLPVAFSVPPVIVAGLPARLVFFDGHALIGNRLVTMAAPPLGHLRDFCRQYA